MSDEQLSAILAGVPIERREFVRRMMAGAFAVPVVASFGMVSPALAGKPTTSNQVNPPDFCITPNQRDGTQGPVLDTLETGDRIRALLSLTMNRKPSSMYKAARRAADELEACDILGTRAALVKLQKLIRQVLADGQIDQPLADQLLRQAQLGISAIDNGGYSTP